MELEFDGELWKWQGPSPWHFVRVPVEESQELAAAAAAVSYGWGMIPVSVRVGGTSWATSLFPKDGQYLLPVKAAVRKAERLTVGDDIAVRLAVDFRLGGATVLAATGRAAV